MRATGSIFGSLSVGLPEIDQRSCGFFGGFFTTAFGFLGFAAGGPSACSARSRGRPCPGCSWGRVRKAAFCHLQLDRFRLPCSGNCRGPRVPGRRVVADRVPLRRTGRIGSGGGSLGSCGGAWGDCSHSPLATVSRMSLDEEPFLGAALEAELAAEVTELADCHREYRRRGRRCPAPPPPWLPNGLPACCQHPAPPGGAAPAPLVVVVAAADEVRQVAAVEAGLPEDRQGLLSERSGSDAATAGSRPAGIGITRSATGNTRVTFSSSRPS